MLKINDTDEYLIQSAGFGDGTKIMVVRKADNARVILSGLQAERWMKVNALQRHKIDVNKSCCEAFRAAREDSIT